MAPTFLRLPLEIRRLIYYYVLTPEMFWHRFRDWTHLARLVVMARGEVPGPSGHLMQEKPHILRVCRQCYDEAAPVLWDIMELHIGRFDQFQPGSPMPFDYQQRRDRARAAQADFLGTYIRELDGAMKELEASPIRTYKNNLREVHIDLKNFKYWIDLDPLFGEHDFANLVKSLWDLCKRHLPSVRNIVLVDRLPDSARTAASYSRFNKLAKSLMLAANPSTCAAALSDIPSLQAILVHIALPMWSRRDPPRDLEDQKAYQASRDDFMRRLNQELTFLKKNTAAAEAV